MHDGSAKLSRPAGSKIHPTVNLSYLCQFDTHPLPSLATNAVSPDLVIAGNDSSKDKFKVTHILDAHINRQYLAADYSSGWYGAGGQIT